MNKLSLLLFVFLLPIITFAADEKPKTTQVVRGKIIDEQTLQPIPGVNILFLESDPIVGTTSDINGVFRFDNIDIGRVSLKFSFVGYYEIKMANIPVDAAALIDTFIKKTKYKSKFLIRQKDRLLTVADEQIAYFIASNKLVVLVTYENRHFPMDETLESYVKQINPDQFFRLNRSYLVQNISGTSLKLVPDVVSFHHIVPGLKPRDHIYSTIGVRTIFL